MAKSRRRLTKFKYRCDAALLKTAHIELEINRAQLDYARQLMNTGFYGNDIWAVFGELINQRLRTLAAEGKIRTMMLTMRSVHRG